MSDLKIGDTVEAILDDDNEIDPIRKGDIRHVDRFDKNGLPIMREDEDQTCGWPTGSNGLWRRLPENDQVDALTLREAQDKANEALLQLLWADEKFGGVGSTECIPHHYIREALSAAFKLRAVLPPMRKIVVGVDVNEALIVQLRAEAHAFVQASPEWLAVIDQIEEAYLAKKGQS